MIGSDCIGEFLWFWKVVRLTMNLRTAMLSTALARITNGTVWVFGKMCERVMLVKLGIKAKFPLLATAATSLEALLLQAVQGSDPSCQITPHQQSS